MLLKSFFSIQLNALLLLLLNVDGTTSEPVTRCVQQCGELEIKYPFGIGPNCSYNKYFEATCETNSPSQKPKSILTYFNFELLNLEGQSVSSDDENSGLSFGKITVNTAPVKSCAAAATTTTTTWTSLYLSGSPFFYDVYRNVFKSIDKCHGNATLLNEKGLVMARCSDQQSNECNCTRDVVSKDPFMRGYSVEVSSRRGKCVAAFLVSRESTLVVDSISGHSDVPLVLGWYINDSNDLENYGALAIGYFFAIIAIIVLMSFLVPMCCAWMFWHLCGTTEKSRDAKLRAKYFNAKLLETSYDREVVKKTKLFTIRELKKATHNFSEVRVLGRGGQGTVYKGMLRNGQIVAVKLSRTFEKSQWKELINELVLLSQVNHRNIVKILGCCLESELPLLVYEFVSNGTLFEHIQNPTGKSFLTWEMRVRIASEAASAIDYLHSSSSIPIFHRDIKSTNILLDDKYQAKVSDFGISKAISIDQSHLTTRVQGTFGYLDPEYFRSSQFSEKSDVYSFGVILVELLTGQPPIHMTTCEEAKSLVEYFTSLMNNSSLYEILDVNIVGESAREDVMFVANLAKQCLHSRGALRPTMKEVASDLERLRRKSFPMPTTEGQVSLEVENVLMAASRLETTTGVSINTCKNNDEDKLLLFTS